MLSKFGHAGASLGTAAPPTPSLPSQTLPSKLSQWLPNVSPDFSTHLLMIPLCNVTNSITKLPLYPLIPRSQNLSCIARVGLYISLCKRLVSSLGKSLSPSTKDGTIWYTAGAQECSLTQGAVTTVKTECSKCHRYSAKYSSLIPSHPHNSVILSLSHFTDKEAVAHRDYVTCEGNTY